MCLVSSNLEKLPLYFVAERSEKSQLSKPFGKIIQLNVFSKCCYPIKKKKKKNYAFNSCQLLN